MFNSHFQMVPVKVSQSLQEQFQRKEDEAVVQHDSDLPPDLDSLLQCLVCKGFALKSGQMISI